MPALARWMAAFGVLLIACDILDWFMTSPVLLGERTLVPGWAGGAIMIASGLLTMAGRTSLRRAGLVIGTFLPLGLAAIYTWHGARLWREVWARSVPVLPAVAFSTLAVLGVVVTWLVFRLRPREGIASRGYAVTVPARRRMNPHQHTGEELSKPRRSEAG
ncbi:hypothetical protein [Fontivita pretiosa]|uniref:hypothetical protein n=1 Tax=Fontivita pretiosa TaxID=2989684 RepID=UPI003D184310